MGCGSPAKSGNEPKAHGQILTGESAGCEALRAERPVDEIRSPLLPGAKRPATMVKLRSPAVLLQQALCS